MNDLFLKIINMSISASWLVLAVLLLRFVLKKAPKWVNVLLWGIVAVRLAFPFSIESALSLIPSAETVPMDIEMAVQPTINSGVPVINSMVNPMLSSFAPPQDVLTSANPLQIWIPIFSILWIAGIAALLLYTVVSYWRLRRKVSEAVILRDNIFQSENVASPFVLGVFRPKIYLPYNMGGQDLNHVVAHEQAHIRRRDHWWKPLGFLLLTIHWFNPLMWLAYVLLCRDIELACDEKVIKVLGNEQRADYISELLRFPLTNKNTFHSSTRNQNMGRRNNTAAPYLYCTETIICYRCGTGRSRFEHGCSHYRDRTARRRCRW
jgi:beta-lactamase regulating signal transducer with metallopeptidase domain